MRAARTFTLDEAISTLPYIRRVVTDLVRDYHAWQATLAEYELASAKRRAAEDGGPGDGGEAARLEKKAAALAKAIESYVTEITAVGAEAKGFAEGLIDFPGEMDGKRIQWCWMLGEATIDHWHELDAGFAGRQPVPVAAGARE